MILNLDVILLLLTIIIFTIVQSVFGVGILVFGTPTLLLLGYSFTETLSYLIPCSIVVSSLQVYSQWNHIGLYRFNVFYYLLPMVAFGLSLVLYNTTINIYLIIGIMLILTSFTRFSSSLNEILGRFLSNHFKIGLAITGVIHGLTNLGGAPLLAITNSIYNKKIKIQANVAYAYLTMAIVQIAILIIYGDFAFDIASLLLLSFSAITYLIMGKHVFENTDEKIYNNLMTFFIFLYGLLLLSNSF